MADIPLSLSIGSREGANNKNEKFHEYSYVAQIGFLEGIRKGNHLLNEIQDKGEEPFESIRNFTDELLSKAEACHMASRKEFQAGKKKLEVTLKRIKERGYYQNYVSALLQENDAAPQGKNWAFTQEVLSGVTQCGARFGFYEIELTDEEWYTAIELSISLHYPDEIMDESVMSYAPHLDELIDEIRAFVVLAHAMYELSARTFQTHKILKMMDTCNGWETEKDALTERISALEAELERKAAIAMRDGEEKDRDLRELRKTVQSLTYENEKLRREKEHMGELWAQEVEALEAAYEAEKTVPEEDSEEDIQRQLTDEELFGSVELPEKDVLFLGGWTSLVHTVKQRHPEWTYINSHEDRHIHGTPYIKTVFFFYGGISHKLTWRVYNELSNDVETVFVSCKNKNRLELEMKRGYALLKNKPAAGQSGDADDEET